MRPFLVIASRRVSGIESTITKAVRADDAAEAFADFFNWLGCLPDMLDDWEIHVQMVSETKWKHVYVCHNESID